ncbi:MAG: VOC family protein [Thermoplasmata archaeon]
MDVDHLGIAVKKLADSVPLYETTLRATASPVEEVAAQKVRVRFLEAGTTHLELLEPTDPDSTVGRFLAARGEGLHHVAFHVASVNDELDRLAADGRPTIDRVARPGARGRRVGFAHPSAHQGVLVEFVEGP